MKFRHEYKHMINLADIFALRARLEAVAERDGHAGADGKYRVKSLYFDNYTDKALREKLDGTDRREKFRIRYYGSDTSFIKLEKKSKICGLCNKESCRITPKECEKIIEGDISFLADAKHTLMRELYAKMRYGGLRPKCIVAYNRESFVHPCGNVRVTIDTDICGSYRVGDFLNPKLEFLTSGGEAILEVKWDEYLPGIIRDCVQLKTRHSSAFSKYAAVRI